MPGCNIEPQDRYKGKQKEKKAHAEMAASISVRMSQLLHVVISMCCSKKRWKNDTTIHFRRSCFAKSIWSTKKGWTQFSSWEFYCRVGQSFFIVLLVSLSLWMLLLFICGSKLSVFSSLLNTWQCCFVFVFRYWCYCCSTNDLASVVLALSCCFERGFSLLLCSVQFSWDWHPSQSPPVLPFSLL